MPPDKTLDPGNSQSSPRKLQPLDAALPQIGVKNLEELQQLKNLLKTPVGMTFNTNVLRIALNMQEEKIACLLVAYYQVKIDEEMVLRAVKTAQIDYLYCLFAYNKNYQELFIPKQYQGGPVVTMDKNSAGDSDEQKYKVFTLDYVIKRLIDYGEENAENRVRQVAQWKLKTTENVLRSLLKNGMDRVATEVALFYIDNADKDLLIFALHNFNEIFLKYAFRNSIFGTNLLSQVDIIDEVLGIFALGSKSELILNVLLFADFSRWEQPKLREFIDMICEILSSGHEKNRILLCYNPIMAIAISSEFVQRIGLQQSIFRHESKGILERLMALGDKIVDNLDDDKIEKCFLDTDFKDRTLLKIITVNKFAPLFSSYKLNILLQEIWEGKASYECDGQITDFSIINYLATSRMQRVPGKRLTAKELVTQNFKVNIDDQKYWYQYKFRSRSISYIFLKDFFSALAMVVLFQYINFQYLTLFNSKQLEGMTYNMQYVLVKTKIEEYNEINYLGTLFSATLVVSLITKLIFNLCVKVQMPLDKWSIIDLLCSLFNIVCFNVIGKTKPEQIIDPEKKVQLDYYVIAVVIVSWLRFFGYFLVIRSISKLIMTLIRMLYDTIAFIFIVGCYYVLASTVFTTLFSQDMPDQYGYVAISFRTLFDAMIGSFSYTSSNNFLISNSIITMIHVFIANIFLLNYLVAILSTVYEIMQEGGEFSYKSNKYEFIEKYSIAMNDPNGYCELVIHPPPLNVFNLILIPFIIRKSWMRKAADTYSKFNFWFENLFYIGGFLLYEIILCPYIYFKVMINIGILSRLKMLVPFILMWTFTGPFILLFSVSKDIFYFMKILCDYQDEEDQFKEKEEEDFKQDKIVIYNEVIDVMRSILHLFQKKKEEAKLRKLALDNQMSATIKNLLADDVNTNDEGHVIEKSLIVEAWTRYRPSSQENTPDENGRNTIKRRDISEIYGDKFMVKLLQGIKQRRYAAGKDDRINEEDKLKNHLTNLLVGGGAKQTNDLDGLNQLSDMDETESNHKSAPIEEVQLIEDFLDKFVFISDSTTSKESIDLNLALRALPLKVEDQNIYRIDLINFNMIQRSLIAFQNDDQDELFNFYDNRSKLRLRKLAKKATENDHQTNELKNVASMAQQAFGRLVNLLGTTHITNMPSEKEKAAKQEAQPYMKVAPMEVVPKPQKSVEPVKKEEKKIQPPAKNRIGVRAKKFMNK